MGKWKLKIDFDLQLVKGASKLTVRLAGGKKVEGGSYPFGIFIETPHQYDFNDACKLGVTLILLKKKLICWRFGRKGAE